jgi:UDP-N-acetylmuramyl pentapeptide phosphotransferase/UDP-N-acetylglucosamine-1-phosphate transferase
VNGRLVWSLVVPAAAAAFLTWTTARLVEAWARHRQLLDVPNARSSHARPTPRLGGIGIVTGVTAGLALAGVVDSSAVTARLVIVVGLALVVASAGLVDDLRSLSVRVRLALQTATALVAVVALDVSTRAQDGSAGGTTGVLLLIAVVWIVGFVNAFNFMDGIDGIAAGQAVVAGIGWAWIGWQLDDWTTAVTGAVLCGAALAFLTLNWAPARIFMGDVGSAFLGFLLAAMPLASAEPLGAAAPALWLVWPFLFDTAFTLARRAYRGENLFEAHRSHLYQRLTTTGLGHAPVASAYVGLAVVGALAANCTRGSHWTGAIAWCALTAALAATLWRWVVVRERAAARAL